ncbi:TAXI family TRAP transporter solute-binding subunit [Deinococcus multiflagellatus]|uniref:TAXI family TRAP transporter solute-binding subunit n=1 Tax=Deinococcus multiflagellatus TaxID=1656887 RepID=A0ABW1ZJW7_9DEIO|nr:TAXI family TRAP transporter solute-binding subunit [Deinococcus multiflagellatus]MBZ9711723.1 transporter substrate-binding domain-containing protein [Deinococcus multiflagellatus]
MIRQTLALLLLCSPALAATPAYLDVATSPKGSTAADMFRDLGQVCTGTSFLRQRQTSGSVENLELLLNNQVSLAFVQLDVLKARDQIDQDPRVRALKTLLPLNFDEVHLIARPAVTTTNLLGRTSVRGIQAFSDLQGRKLGAWGGSVITARVLSAKAGVPMTIQEYRGRDEAMAALNAGQVDAVLAVAGQPADWIKALNPAAYRLVPLNIAPARVNGFYRPATLRYPGLGEGVTTYAVQRLLVTRDFKTPERRAALLNYQKCALSKLTQLQETQGFHPKWSDVTFKEQNWPWFK